MINYKIIKNKILITLIFIVLFSHFCIASNIIYNSGDITPIIPDKIVSVHNDSSFESQVLSSSSELMEEELIEAYKKEISDAVMSVYIPPKFNLPTIYVQDTFHPNFDNDIFGKVSDDMPISSVKVENEDEQRKNCMCLTFDSAFINDYTYRILDILDEYDIKSTFFMTYDFMKNNPEHVMEIIKRGHEIGNHTTTHPDLNKLSDSKIIVEVLKAHNFLKDLLGVDMCLFRFPYGSYSPRTVSLLKNLGYYPIQWSLDSIDWKNEEKTFLIERFVENKALLNTGSIILFHNGAKYTPDALPVIIKMIYDKGLKCVKVSDLIYKHDFHILSGKQIKGQIKNAN